MLLKRGEVVLGVRPHAVHRTSHGAPARVVTNQWLGDQSHIAASFAGKTVVLVEHDRAALSDGEAISIEIRPGDLHLRPRNRPRAEPRPQAGGLSHGGCGYPDQDRRGTSVIKAVAFDLAGSLPSPRPRTAM